MTDKIDFVSRAIYNLNRAESYLLEAARKGAPFNDLSKANSNIALAYAILAVGEQISMLESNGHRSS